MASRTIRRKRKRSRFLSDADKFNTFFLAEKLGKTVDELLTGRKRPLSNIEFTRWMAYLSVKAELERQARNKANNS